MAADYFRDNIYFTPQTTLHFDTSLQTNPQNEIPAKLTLVNKGPASQGQNLAFKIKTTKPQSYQVKPIAGIVAP
jgi:hypothetical protein